MNEQELRDYTRDHLDDLLPVRLSSWSFESVPGREHPDVLLHLETASGELKAVCEFITAPTRAKIAQLLDWVSRSRNRSDYIPLLISEHLSESLQVHCRDAGFPYLDISGNVWIEHPNLVVFRSSQPRRFADTQPDRNPFADKASLVLRYLFAKGKAGGVRDMAGSVGLNPGYTSRVVNSAEELGYVRIHRDRTIHLVAPEEVLGDWSSFYNWKRNRIRHFELPAGEGADPLLSYLEKTRNAALTMHAGANLLDSFVYYRGWHVYCKGEREQREIVKHLGLAEVAEGAGDVVLLKPYYRESTFYELQFPDGVPVVSDLQLYLDLCRFPVRGQEIAERILVKRIRPEFSGGEDD